MKNERVKLGFFPHKSGEVKIAVSKETHDDEGLAKKEGYTFLSDSLILKDGAAFSITRDLSCPEKGDFQERENP